MDKRRIGFFKIFEVFYLNLFKVLFYFKEFWKLCRKLNI